MVVARSRGLSLFKHRCEFGGADQGMLCRYQCLGAGHLQQRGAVLLACRKRFARNAKQIKAVTIDMSNGYRAWVAEVLLNCEII